MSGSLACTNAGSAQHWPGGVQRGAAGGRRQLQQRPTAWRLVWQRPASPVCRAGSRPCRGACLLAGGQGRFVRAALCCGRTACAGGRRRAAHERAHCPATAARVLHGLRRALAGQGPRATRVCALQPAAPTVAAGLRGVLNAQRVPMQILPGAGEAVEACGRRRGAPVTRLGCLAEPCGLVAQSAARGCRHLRATRPGRRRRGRRERECRGGQPACGGGRDGCWAGRRRVGEGGAGPA